MEVSPLWGSLTASEEHIQAHSCELPVRKRNELLRVLGKLCPHPRSIVLHEGNYKSTFPSLPKKENNSPLKKGFWAKLNCPCLGQERFICLYSVWWNNDLKTDTWQSCERGQHVGRVEKHCDGGVYSHLSSRKGNLNITLVLVKPEAGNLGNSPYLFEILSESHKRTTRPETQPSRAFKAMVNSE